MYSTLVATLLVGAVAAAPSSKLHARGSGTTFSLITTISDAPAPVGELNNGIWALGLSSDGRAVLVDRSQQALFYEYTDSESSAIATGNTGIIITPGGTGTVPSSNEVDLIPQNATPGVFIGLDEENAPLLQFETGSLMACKASFLTPNTENPDDIVLSYRSAGQRRFADCADVYLIANCAGSGSGSDEVGVLGQPVIVSCQPN